MSPDTSAIFIATAAIMLTVIGTGIALALAILPGQRELRREMTIIHREIGDLRDRVSCIEGILRIHGMNGGPRTRRVYVTDKAPPEAVTPPSSA